MFPGTLTYGSAYVGPYDLWFVTHASNLWWYNHWAEMVLYQNYFDAASWAARQQAMATYQAQHMAVNANYLDPNVDPDLQFSPEYQESHMGTFYSAPPSTGPSAGSVFLVIFLIIAGIIIVYVIYRAVAGRRSYGGGSGIY